MKRRHAHLLFGTLTLACAVSTLIYGARLRQARSVNALIAASADADARRAQVQPLATGAVPEARLARALALSRAGDFDGALRVFEALAQSERAELRRIARFDLGNLYLRQSVKIADFEVAKARTLTELAKQNYRRVLEDDPDDWPARYNLERALWLEPERDEGPIEVATPPAVNRPNGDKPELP